jgi:hypothetical protein
MANLQTCLGSSEIGHNYTIKIHAVFVWADAGSCMFIQSSPSVVEVKGTAKIVGSSYDFDIIITDGSGGQPVLTVNGTADPGATLSGCTVQASSTLKGMKISFSPDGKDTELETPNPYPNIKIA